MFSRIRIALSLALLLTLSIASTVFAKGSFAFVAIMGPNLKSEIRTTDPALTTDFFAFADLYRNRVDAPTNPGQAYEITRYYIDYNRENAFDRLHYYPDTGYVFYDGIVNGSSEYDGQWYKAVPGIKDVFEKTLLAVAPIVEAKPAQAEIQKAVVPLQSETTTDRAQSILTLFQRPVIPIVFASGLALILIFAVWSRRPASR